MRRGASAATLYSVDPGGIGGHDAVIRIGGKAPSGGPILQQRHQGHGRKRDTATSDRHRQSCARKRSAPNRCFSCLLPPLRRPSADGPLAPGRS
jgi:hypothetical protein